MADGKGSRRSTALRRPPERYKAFMDGTLDVSQLDDEEVVRMQLKSSDGSFKGKPPQSIPREFAMAMQSEAMKRHKTRMTELVKAAEDTLAMLLSPYHIGGPGDAAKIKAAQYVIDRYAGKAPEVVHSTNVTKHTFEDTLDELYVDIEEDEDDFK